MSSQEQPLVPQEATPQKTLPQESMIERTLPQETTPQSIAPQETLPKESVPQESVIQSALPQESVIERTQPQEPTPQDPPPKVIAPEGNLNEGNLKSKFMSSQNVTQDSLPVFKAQGEDKEARGIQGEIIQGEITQGRGVQGGVIEREILEGNGDSHIHTNVTQGKIIEGTSSETQKTMKLGQIQSEELVEKDFTMNEENEIDKEDINCANPMIEGLGCEKNKGISGSKVKCTKEVHVKETKERRKTVCPDITNEKKKIPKTKKIHKSLAELEKEAWGTEPVAEAYSVYSYPSMTLVSCKSSDIQQRIYNKKDKLLHLQN